MQIIKKTSEQIIIQKYYLIFTFYKFVVFKDISTE